MATSAYYSFKYAHPGEAGISARLDDKRAIAGHGSSESLVAVFATARKSFVRYPATFADLVVMLRSRSKLKPDA